MVSFKQVFAAAALLSLGSAAPVAQSESGLSFSVREIPNPDYVPEDHLTLYRRALDKANPDRISKRAASVADKSGSVAANAQFNVPVKVGTQTFLITFDTGSSDMWIVGDGMTGQGKHTFYKPGSTAKIVSGATFNASYADGSSGSGDVYTDNVNIGKVSVAGMEIGHAKTATSWFVQGQGDGMMGLGPGTPTIKPGPAKTFMDTLAAQGGQKLFAVNLHKDAPGTYDFGMTDASKYTGPIAYTAANIKSGYWLIETDDKIPAIIDTGTTVTVLPKSVASAYWAQVKSAKSSVAGTHNSELIWDYDCTETLPDYSLKVGGQTVKVPGHVINMGPSGVPGKCTGGLQTNTDFKNWNIIGAMFIKGLYVVYDFGTNGGPSRIGFAAKSAKA